MWHYMKFNITAKPITDALWMPKVSALKRYKATLPNGRAGVERIGHKIKKQ